MNANVSPTGRTFHRFERWPMVPAEDLLELRCALLAAQKASEPSAASELLILVDHEISRRGLDYIGSHVL